MQWIALYVLGALVAWYYSAGMVFAHAQGRWPRLAARDRRQDLGWAVLFGLANALIWPIGIPLVWRLTGFAEHGIWRAHGEDAPETH